MGNKLVVAASQGIARIADRLPVPVRKALFHIKRFFWATPSQRDRGKELVLQLFSWQTTPGWILSAVWATREWRVWDTMTDGWILGLGLLWIFGAIAYASRGPRRHRLIEVYPTQRRWWNMGWGLSEEVSRASRVWVAFETGANYLSDLTDPKLMRRVERMVLLSPDSSQVAYWKGQTKEEALEDDIRVATKTATEHGTEVRHSMAPVMNCVVGLEPEWGGGLKPAWIRVQLFLPHQRGPERTNVLFTRRTDRHTFRHLVDAYQKMWDHSTTPSDDGTAADQSPANEG